MAVNTTIDLTRGVYRRMYSGFVMGRRINAVSVDAECLFWRLNAIADDFGNFNSGGLYVRNHAAPLRRWSVAKIDALVVELAAAGLIDTYEVGQDHYASIRDFMELQPAGRNGRRVQRYPRNPRIPHEPDLEPANADSGESGASGFNVQVHTCSYQPTRSISTPTPRPSAGDPGEPRADAGLAGLAECFRRHGLHEPAYSTFVTAPELTAEIVDAEVADIRRDPKAGNIVGVLVTRLEKLTGRKVPKSERNRLRGEDALTNGKFLALKEQRTKRHPTGAPTP